MECASDCANRITVRECGYDALAINEGAELGVVTLWLWGALRPWQRLTV
jgi:hypothetical protein